MTHHAPSNAPLPTAASPSAEIPVVILGSTGYVAGELLRLLAGHPVLRPAFLGSESQAGARVAEVFPHLAVAYPTQRLASRQELAAFFGQTPRAAVFSALQHGAAAPLIDETLDLAAAGGAEVSLVDLSADFRFADAAAYAEVYGHAHPVPARLASFTSGLPEHVVGCPSRHVGHPGCFVTSVLVPVVALLRLGLITPRVFVSAITGSTGAGKTPTAKTHHPERRSNLYAYNPLTHRHAPEIQALVAAATGTQLDLAFVPHSGPHARGIYSTLHCQLAAGVGSTHGSAAAVREALREFYRDAPFVQVGNEPPRLQDVVGSNLCQLGVAQQGETLVVFSALDNLVKGAAGGGIQWMNRLWGLPETLGLQLPGLGWF